MARGRGAREWEWVWWPQGGREDACDGSERVHFKRRPVRFYRRAHNPLPGPSPHHHQLKSHTYHLIISSSLSNQYPHEIHYIPYYSPIYPFIFYIYVYIMIMVMMMMMYWCPWWVHDQHRYNYVNYGII